MENWKEYRQQLGTRINELNVLSPDIMKGLGIVGAAGEKTNHLDAKTRELIALAVAVTTRCDGCIAVHSMEAKKLGATKEEVAEAMSVAISLNAGAALVYSTRVLDAFDAS